MSTLNPKRLLLEELASLARVLGNPYRLEILELLAQADMPVELLTARTGLTFANVSQHLQQLKRAGLVVGRRDGKRVVYQLAEGPVNEAVSGLRALAEHNITRVGDLLQTYFQAPDELEPIGAVDLLERMQTDSVTLLDVRPADEFATGHLPGALNIEIDELERRLGELTLGRDIVAYCRGPYCMLSIEAVRMLRARGYNAQRLHDGLPEWRAAGHPVEGTTHAPLTRRAWAG